MIIHTDYSSFRDPHIFVVATADGSVVNARAYQQQSYYEAQVGDNTLMGGAQYFYSRNSVKGPLGNYVH